jgi:hypothetical protein
MGYFYNPFGFMLLTLFIVAWPVPSLPVVVTYFQLRQGTTDVGFPDHRRCRLALYIFLYSFLYSRQLEIVQLVTLLSSFLLLCRWALRFVLDLFGVIFVFGSPKRMYSTLQQGSTGIDKFGWNLGGVGREVYQVGDQLWSNLPKFNLCIRYS